MQFTFWDSLFNVFLLVLWFRIWTEDDRSLLFNSTIAPLGRLANAIVEFVRPVLFGLPPKTVAAACMVFVIVFRAVLFHGMSGARPVAWMLEFGFETHGPQGNAFSTVLFFSALSFALFLFKVWGFSLIYVHGRVSPTQHAPAAVYHVSRPFSDVRAELRPAFFLGCGVFVGFALRMTTGQAVGDTPVLVAFLQVCISAAAEWAELLVMIRFLVIVCILGSWAAMFGGSRGLGALCHEWLGFLMGPLRRYPIRVGMIDLTPLIFLIALPIVHTVLLAILSASLAQLV